MGAVPNPSLDAGLDALQQANYSDAIAHFEAVRETELDDSLVTQASQALVTAYQRSGDWESAIALCQNLTHHPDPNVHEWATSTLADLNANYLAAPSNTSASESTGFVPFNPTPSQSQTPQQRTPLKIKQRLTDSTKRLFSNAKTQDTQTSSTPTQGKVDSRRLANAGISGNSRSNSASTAQNPSLLPASYSPPSTPVSSLFTPRPRWRNSGRAENWSPLKRAKLRRLWLVEIVTLVALFGVLEVFVRFVMQTTNATLVKFPFLSPIQLFYRDPAQAIAISLAILLIVSPWLLDTLLKYFHGLESLPLTQLASRSPEAAKVVQRLCRQRKLPIPTLGILPTDAPVALTYGNLPWTARIVVSQGLLAQLADDEVASIYAGQLGHIAHWDIILMSLGVLILQIPYTIYWQVAQGGERFADFVERKLPSYGRFLPAIVRGITGAIASISYGIYWLLSLPLLWLSRARVYYSDRLAVETTGNPNGLTRALLKIALGITEEIQHDRKTSGLLESFDLLLPVGYRQALTLGSCSPHTPFETVLQWDCTNPYRDWLIVSASHPLLGERAAMLGRNAQFWKLDPELNLSAIASGGARSAIAPPARTPAAWLSKLTNAPKAFPLLQSAVFFGLLLGIILRGLLWAMGQIGDRLNIWQVIWMHNARPFLDACILIAFSLSLFLWINRYFPDIKPSTVRTEPKLGEFFANPATLPPDSEPVQITGKLLGRRGLLNWLGQDLILQTSTGLVRLHFSSFLGPLGNLLPKPNRPSNLVDQQVTVTGWFRRSVTPWIDIETLRSQGGKVTQANYPLWLTLLALAAAVWGAYQIWQA
jgi:Zn-dependent protease with chaperone function